MTTVIEDNELDAELQELYLVGKQWISELDFLGTELGFLRKLSENTTNGVARIPEPAKLDVIEQTSLDLKKDLVLYLRELEPLIIASEKHLKLNLIEINIRLKQGLAQVLIDFQSAKKAIFDYCKPHLKKKHALIFCNYG